MAPSLCTGLYSFKRIVCERRSGFSLKRLSVMICMRFTQPHPVAPPTSSITLCFLSEDPFPVIIVCVPAYPYTKASMHGGGPSMVESYMAQGIFCFSRTCTTSIVRSAVVFIDPKHVRHRRRRQRQTGTETDGAREKNVEIQDRETLKSEAKERNTCLPPVAINKTIIFSHDTRATSAANSHNQLRENIYVLLQEWMMDL